MTACFVCGNDMKEVESCTKNRTIVIDGNIYAPTPSRGPCHDCGVIKGEYHHPGCDMEECPRCGGQYFICDCVTKEKKILWEGIEAD